MTLDSAVLSGLTKLFDFQTPNSIQNLFHYQTNSLAQITCFSDRREETQFFTNVAKLRQKQQDNTRCVTMSIKYAIKEMVKWLGSSLSMESAMMMPKDDDVNYTHDTFAGTCISCQSH